MFKVRDMCARWARSVCTPIQGTFRPTFSCLTFRLICYLFVEFWPIRASFGMARGLRFWALGVDSGPREGAFEGIWDPTK